MSFKRRSIFINVIAASLFALTGCQDGTATIPVPPPQEIMTGSVMDGANPIAHSEVSLYQATNANPVVLGQTISNADGSFNLNYNLPALGSYVYLIANGGAVKNEPSNTNISLVNIVGVGGSLPSTTTINEITTVGSYQTFTGDWNISTATPILEQTNENTNGMGVGFSTYKSLVNLITGDLSTLYPINTTTGSQLAGQANVLSLCVQNENNCSDLSNILNTANKDTFSLMVGLKQATATAVSSVNTLLDSNVNILPYNTGATLKQMALSINYSGANYGFNSPSYISSDSKGNIWITSATGNSVTELQRNEDGTYSAQLFNSANNFPFNSPQSISVDNNDNIWVSEANGVMELKKMQDGTYIANPFSSSTYGFNNPLPITADNQGNIWVGDYQGPYVTELRKETNGTYTPQKFTVYGSTGFYQYLSYGIIADKEGNIWSTDYNGSHITEIKNNGDGTYTPVLFASTDYNYNGPFAITADSNDNIWITSTNVSPKVIELLKNQNYMPNVFSSSNFGFDGSVDIKPDNNDNLWIVNRTGNSLTEILKQANGEYVPVILSDPSYGFSSPWSATIDGSNNIWVVNQGTNSVTEIIN